MNAVHQQIQAAVQELRKAADAMSTPEKLASGNDALFEKQANIYRNLVYLHLVSSEQG